MTVESNYVIAIATLSDWLKRLAPVFQPMRMKTKTNRTMYAWFFPRFERVTGNCWELWLVHRAACSYCDWSESLLWFWSLDSHLKIALTSFLQTVSHSLMALPNEIFFWWHVITGSEEKLQGKLLVVTHVQKLISQCGTCDALKLSGNLREKLCKITAILVLNSFKRHSHSNRHDINWMIRARATHDSVDAVALTGLEQTNKETVKHHKFKRS